MVYTNADSLRNKLDELKIRIQNAKPKPQVICITEFKGKHPGNNQIEMVEYNLDGYNLIHNNDTDTCHRGVLIYVDKSLSVMPVNCGLNFAEYIFVKIKVNASDHTNRMYLSKSKQQSCKQLQIAGVT